jgi:hypothetical protein
VTGTEWLFRYPQNKRNNGRRNGDCLAARWFPQGKTAQLFVTGELYSLDKEPLMGDPFCAAIGWMCLLNVFLF